MKVGLVVNSNAYPAHISSASCAKNSRNSMRKSRVIPRIMLFQIEIEILNNGVPIGQRSLLTVFNSV